MQRQIGKMFGSAMAMMCLVSILATAQPLPPGVPPPPGTPPAPSLPMVCTKVDMSGNCVEAKAQDDKMVTVLGEGVKVGEKMTCVTVGDTTKCVKVTTVK
jgi:hypothetical protein